MGSKVSRASPDSLAKWINLAEIKAANLVNRANPVRVANPDNQGSKQMEIRLAELVRRVHRMAVRTVGQLAVRAAELGLAAPVRSIASGTAAIPEATGRRVAKRNQFLPRRKKFSDLTRRPCAS
jgi:hypothetical protein